MPCLEVIRFIDRIVTRLAFHGFPPRLVSLPSLTERGNRRSLGRIGAQSMEQILRVLALASVFLDELVKILRRGHHFIKLRQASHLHLHRPLELGGCQWFVVVEFHPRFIDERALGRFWIGLEVEIHSFECLVRIKHSRVHRLLAGAIPIVQSLVVVLVLIDPRTLPESVKHRRRWRRGLRYADHWHGRHIRLSGCRGESFRRIAIHQWDVGDFKSGHINR